MILGGTGNDNIEFSDCFTFDKTTSKVKALALPAEITETPKIKGYTSFPILSSATN